MKKRLREWLQLPDPTGPPANKELTGDETALKKKMDKLLRDRLAELKAELEQAAKKMQPPKKKPLDLAPMQLPKAPAGNKPPDPDSLDALYKACASPELEPVSQEDLDRDGGTLLEDESGQRIAMTGAMKFFPPGIWLWRITDAQLEFIKQQNDRSTLPRALPVLFKEGPCDGIGSEDIPFKAPPVGELPLKVCMIMLSKLPDGYKEGERVKVEKGVVYAYVSGPRSPDQFFASEECGHPHGEHAVYHYVRPITPEEIEALSQGKDLEWS